MKPLASPVPALTVESVRADLDRAAKGDTTALPTVRLMLQLPKCVEEAGGNLARTAENLTLHQIAGTDLLMREAVRRKAELLRAELGGPNPSALERLVVGRVVASWLAVYYAEAFVAQEKGLTVRQADHWQRRIDRAHGRLLSAARTLATIRRVPMPAVLAQVNVTTTSSPTPPLGQRADVSSNCSRSGVPAPEV